MADLRIVDAPEIPTENITGEEKLPTGGSGNYSITLDSLANYTKTKKDLADNTSVDNKVNGVRQELDAHIEDLTNPHQVTKDQIGLGNVDNTADADKPVSNSTQAAIISAVSPKADKSYVDNQLTLKSNKAETYTKQESSDLVNNSISTALTPVNSSLDLAKRGIANRYDPSLTYNSGERVVLANGDIVKSTIDGNTNDPNVDMTGWVSESTLRQDLANPDKGAAMVGYSTDTVASRLSQSLSIFDFMTGAQISDVQSRAPTMDLQAAFDAATVELKHRGGGTLLIPPGVYRLKHWLLYQVKNVTIWAYGAKLEYYEQPPAIFGNFLEFLDCDHVSVLGMTVSGRSVELTPSEGQLHNVASYGSRNISWIDMVSEYALCDGFYVDRWVANRYGHIPTVTSVDSENITLINTRSRYGFRQGMSVISVQNLWAQNCVFSHTGMTPKGGTSPMAGVDLESNVGFPWSPKSCTFDNCTFEENGGTGFISTTSSKGTTLRNCLVKNSVTAGITLRGEGNYLENVTIDGFGETGDFLRPGLDLSIASVGGVVVPTTLIAKNLTIRNGKNIGAGITLELGVRASFEKVNIDRVKYAGIRMFGGSVYNWSRLDLKDCHISNVTDDGASYSYVAYATFAGASPIFIDGLTIDNSLSLPNAVARGVDFFGSTNVVECKGLHIIGELSDFKIRSIQNVKRLQPVLLDGVQDNTASVIKTESIPASTFTAHQTKTYTVTLGGIRAGDVLYWNCDSIIPAVSVRVVATENGFRIFVTNVSAADLSVTDMNVTVSKYALA